MTYFKKLVLALGVSTLLISCNIRVAKKFDEPYIIYKIITDISSPGMCYYYSNTDKDTDGMINRDSCGMYSIGDSLRLR